MILKITHCGIKLLDSKLDQWINQKKLLKYLRYIDQTDKFGDVFVGFTVVVENR